MHETRALVVERPVAYANAVAYQEQCVAARMDDRISDTVIFLQHTPVITLGSRGKRDHLMRTEKQLHARGIELHASTRGGDITYHAPGQLVMYPIIRLGDREADAHGYLCNLEEVAIRTIKEYGINAYRREGMTGAWTDHGKVTAIGVRFKRWVTQHGLALNVDIDLSGFSAIVPCGLEGESVSSLQTILGDECPSLEEVRVVMMRHFGDVCGRPIHQVESVLQL